MADLRLESPAAFRWVAAAAATVASLALVALGVQIGTDGLGSDGPDRNPASATASPAAAIVDLARPRALPSLDQTLLSLLPLSLPSITGAGGSPLVAAGGAVGTATGTTPAPSGGTTEPAPAPAPSPVPVPTPTPPQPSPAVPDPDSVLEPVAPVLDPIVDGVVDPLIGLGESSSSTDATAESDGLLPTLTTLLGL